MVDLKQGDCLELMKAIPDGSVDLILTDPPYTLSLHGGGVNEFGSRKLTKEKHIGFMSKGFPYEEVFVEFLRIAKVPNFLIFCSNQQVSKIMRFFEERKLSVTLLVWNKTNPAPLCNGKYVSDLEFIVYVRGKGATFNNKTPFDYKKKLYSSGVMPSKNRLHPAQKPVELLEQYIQLHSNLNDVVLDPFMGSGSTGLACVNNGRNFIGYELEQKYFDIAAERIEQAKTAKQMGLFDRVDV